MKNSTQQMITNQIKTECACLQHIKYKKLVTSGNDPTSSRKMRYSAYMRTCGKTQSYNMGSKTFTNIGIIPPLTEKQIRYQYAMLGLPYIPPEVTE